MSFETVANLACLRRGDREELRMELTKVNHDRGGSSQFVSARIWSRGSGGEMAPTKTGITIRAHELKAFAIALKEAFVRIGSVETSGEREPPIIALPALVQHRTVQGTPIPRQRNFADDDGDITAGGRL